MSHWLSSRRSTSLTGAPSMVGALCPGTAALARKPTNEALWRMHFNPLKMQQKKREKRGLFWFLEFNLLKSLGEIRSVKVLIPKIKDCSLKSHGNICGFYFLKHMIFAPKGAKNLAGQGEAP